jgi:hypothetical protein
LLERATLHAEKMSTSAKRPSRFVVVLKLPEYQVPRLLVHARGIVERMSGNPWFPSPRPTLAVIQAAIDDLSDAETNRLTRTKGTVEVRDEKRTVLVLRLQHLAAYVEAIASANAEQAASIIESAGMYLEKAGGRAPQVFAAEPGSHSGEVKLRAPRAGDRAAYEFQYSLDGGVARKSLPVTTKASGTVRAPKPGSTVHFRYRATVKGVTGDWSDPIAIIVG